MGQTVDKELWKDHTNGTNNKLWDDAVIPYKISNVPTGLKTLINKAVNEFNNKTPVHWVAYKYKKHNNYIVFELDNVGGCRSQYIGKNGGKQSIYLAYPYYPSPATYKTKVICVLHEMMHAIGFHHEMARTDAIHHISNNIHSEYSDQVVSFGQYDYKSIMHYPCGWGFKAKNKEIEKYADKSPTFSQGDLAGLRRIYGQVVIKKSIISGKVHFGEWHKKCSSSCTKTSCGCGACGQLPGGVNCGYEGMDGHWSCCLNENYYSNCNDTHTGFWHMRCTDSRCTSSKCYCNSCGGGCRYIGYKGHWSCCKSENFNGKCVNNTY